MKVLWVGLVPCVSLISDFAPNWVGEVLWYGYDLANG